MAACAFIGRSLALCGLALIGPRAVAEPGPPTSIGIAILHAAAWAPGDAARVGASEFEVLLRIAQLKKSHRVAGLISVGDRHGMRPSGGELALHRAVLTGVPVVKLARGGEVASTPDDLFVDARWLTPDQARATLELCLKRFGAPPATLDPDQPTTEEIARIRFHLARFREVFERAGTQLAAAN